MNITIYKNYSDANVVGKDLKTLQSLTGTIRDAGGVDIMNPFITISGDYNFAANYCFIPQFGRYYFIKNVKIVRENIYELELHVDVLQTYRSQIRNLEAIVNRQEYIYEPLLSDSKIKHKAKPKLQTLTFPNGFNSGSTFVLPMAGQVGIPVEN